MPLAFRADVQSVDEAARTVDIVFSTGASVLRYDWMSGKRYIEKLGLEPSNVRLTRLNSVGSLLDSHSSYSVADVLGAVERGTARLEKGLGLASIRFSKRDAVEPIFRDVVDGILRSFSVGYNVYKYVEDSSKEGQIPTRTATDWEPFEISLVPMPADIGATLRSGDKSRTHPCVIETTTRNDDSDRIRRYRSARACQ